MAALVDPGPIELTSVLQRSASSGAACFIEVPFDLKVTYGVGNLVPVHALWDGRVEYRGSLARMGGPCALLLCRKDVVAQLGKAAGDAVHVRITLDTAPREVEVPDDLREALSGDAAASAAWDTLAPSCRREYASWIAEAKKADTRARRVAQALPMIAERKRLKG